MDLRKKILAAQDIKNEQVYIPEWDVTIEVRTMTGTQRAQVIKTAVDEKGNINTDSIYPELLIATCFDPNTSKPIFTEKDKTALNNKSGAVLERLGQIAMTLSGLTKESIEEAEKNSSSGIQSGNSISN